MTNKSLKICTTKTLKLVQKNVVEKKEQNIDISDKSFCFAYTPFCVKQFYHEVEEYVTHENQKRMKLFKQRIFSFAEN